MARDHDVDSLSRRLPPPPFPMSLWSCDLLECCHHRRAHYHCGQPWNYQRGTSLAEETVRDAWNQTKACSNPVIKILHWMLILWKKPNDFTGCLISESDEKPKSIQQNGSTLYTIWAAGRKVHQCGGAAREKKNEVLYYKARHWSQIFALRNSAEFGNSTDSSKMKTGGYDNIKLT